MYNDIQQLKLVNGWLLDQVSARFPCGVRKYTMVEFNDPRVGPIQTTDSISIFDGFFNNLTVRGGGDCPEMVMKGLKVALEESPDHSFILVLTDASAKDYNDENLKRDVYALIKTKQSKIFFLVTGLCAGRRDPKFLIYRDIASLSFGHVFEVSLSKLNKVFYYLDFTLSRPINSSTQLLSKDYDGEDHSVTFSVAENYTSLLLTTDGMISSLLITDPYDSEIKPKTVISEPWGSMYIVEKHAIGSWTLRVNGTGHYAIRVEGFKVKNISYTRHCSQCHFNAICEDYFGIKECSCNEGFVGDGFACSDIDECAYPWSNNCPDICVNVLGSYVCECPNGFTKNTANECVDIDECSDPTLYHCQSLANCSKNEGDSSCTCKSDYKEDGFQCKEEECARSLCGQGLECLNEKGSYKCLDPCSSYTTLNEPWRSILTSQGDNCDSQRTGWYRFTGSGGIRLAESCVPENKCGTEASMWMNGSHPFPNEGIVSFTACAQWDGNCCYWSTIVEVKACPDGYHVYKLHGTPRCPAAYCTDPTSENNPCSCAKDEECIKVNGIVGCYCKNGRDVQRLEDLDLNLQCNTHDMEMSFRACQLKSLNAKNIHFSNNRCLGVKGQDNTSMIYITSPLQDGKCRARLYSNGTHAIYWNTMYVQLEPSDIIVRHSELQLNFSCSYPLDLTIKTSVIPVLSSMSFNIEGVGEFKAHIAVYKDQSYLSKYEDKEVVLSTSSTLYVEVFLEGLQSSHYITVMKNCYATPGKHIDDPIKYYIIKERCPNKEDPSIKMLENGVSSQGRFSLQMFRFVGEHNLVYLHCEINVCDSEKQKCKPIDTEMGNLVNTCRINAYWFELLHNKDIFQLLESGKLEDGKWRKMLMAKSLVKTWKALNQGSFKLSSMLIEAFLLKALDLVQLTRGILSASAGLLSVLLAVCRSSPVTDILLELLTIALFWAFFLLRSKLFVQALGPALYMRILEKY
ncbi:uromodulin-like [Hyla sarda]|uniref:uromodulin-like n=1 Tax=Hyla sarda TaxID=327740 RepID=UPI0024C38F90|nr:uromodulin-like [Hyla sarda]